MCEKKSQLRLVLVFSKGDLNICETYKGNDVIYPVHSSPFISLKEDENKILLAF